MKTDREYMRVAIDYIKQSDKFPDDYEDVNGILTGLALLTQLEPKDPNGIKTAIEAAFRLGWERRGAVIVDRTVWDIDTPAR